MASIYKLGSRGVGVKLIQSALGQAGWPVIVDGDYGYITRDAVIEFQKTHGLTADGIVGPATLAYLIPDAGCAAIGLKKSRREIREIIIHCTATREGRDATVEEIRQDHMRNRGWSDIGYHYVIDRKGRCHDGRDVNIIGAHCYGHNTYSIGVAYVGGLENKPGVPYEQLKPKDTRTLAQKATLLTLLTDLRKLYPYARICGHHDFDSSKACPSFDAKSEYQLI